MKKKPFRVLPPLPFARTPACTILFMAWLRGTFPGSRMVKLFSVRQTPAKDFQGSSALSVLSAPPNIYIPKVTKSTKLRFCTFQF